MTTNAEPCIHRWRIETPNGRLSPGTCVLCGASKSFPNSDPQDWGPNGRSSWRDQKGLRL